MMNPLATEADILSMISMSSEFDSIKFREEESKELKQLVEEDAPCQVAGDVDSPQGKTNILLQAFCVTSPYQGFSIDFRLKLRSPKFSKNMSVLIFDCHE